MPSSKVIDGELVTSSLTDETVIVLGEFAHTVVLHDGCRQRTEQQGLVSETSQTLTKD